MKRTLQCLVTILVMVSALVSLTACRGRRAADHRANGDRFFADKKYPEALIEYKVALQADPRAADVRFKAAEAYAAVGGHADAWREYVRAADLAPSNSGYQLKAATSLWMAGQYEDARLRAEQVLSSDPRNVDAHIIIANSLAGLKNVDGAVESIQRAIAIDPRRSGTWANLGTLEQSRRRQKAAEAAFLKAIDVEPTSVNPRLAAAQYYATTNQTAKAEQQLKEALSISPDSWQASRALASLYMGAGRTNEAGPYLEAIAKGTHMIGSRLDLADYHVRENQIETAKVELEALTEDPQGLGEATIRLATLAFADGHRDEAYRRLDSVLARQPKHVGVLVAKARLLLTDKRLDPALSTVLAATQADPNSVPALYALGLIQMERHDQAAAEQAFTQALAQDPRLDAARSRLSQLRLAASDPKHAVQLAEQSVKHDPRDVRARVSLIRGLMASGTLDRASAEVAALLKSRPDVAAVHVTAGAFYFMKRDLVQARARFARGLELDPTASEALRGLSALDIAFDRKADARQRVEAAVGANPNDAGLRMVEGEVLAMLGDASGAERAWRKAIELDPALPQAYGSLAAMYLSQRRLDQALQEIDAIAVHQPKSVAAHTLAAAILDVQGKRAESQKRYEHVIEMDPEAVVAANNLAWMYASSDGNLDRALQLAQAATAKRPNDPEVLDTLGWIYLQKNLVTMAIDALEVSVAKDPSSAPHRYHLGLAYYKAGAFDQARQRLQEAIKLHATFDGADDARKILQGLGPGPAASR
jgi:tetratricopeptide (TPR) repeat protein